MRLNLSEGDTATPRSNAASAASAAKYCRSGDQYWLRVTQRGPRELPGTIEDIDNREFAIDQYLDNIQDSWFGDPHKSSDNGADPREKYWQF